MQTFLPSTSFEQSAKWLDNARLGKQRVECLQILKALTDPNYGWQNHPAVRMWRGYEWALVEYGLTMCVEWMNRGYKDNCRGQILAINIQPTSLFPYWLTEDFAANHQSILLGKALEAHEKYRSRMPPYYDASTYNQHFGADTIAGYWRTKKLLNWYYSHNWTEQPAQRNSEGRWPYIWPVTN